MQDSSDFLLNTPSGPQWNRIGLKPHHGVNIALFSIRSHQSSGIGEFLDLIPLINWLAPLGFDILQLLPINETDNDASPYNLLSAYALNPLHISLESIDKFDETVEIKGTMHRLKLLNQTERVDYLEIAPLKYSVLERLILPYLSTYQENAEFLKFKQNAPWLESYASSRAKLNTALVLQEGLEKASFYYKILQFIAYRQMEEVKQHAEKMGMFLMGDIPILLSRHSIDVQTKKELFLENQSIGAPPDRYAIDGQNWGFPPYNFPAIEKENFQFWKERLQAASKLYHLYRIDHIVGFFRMWSIPEGSKAHEGHYIPKDPEAWFIQGKSILTAMVEHASMLAVGEDLGVIPKETKDVMHRLGIPGTKVVFWERDWLHDQAFIPFAEYPPNSLTTLSTHDSELFSVWWKTHPHDAKEFAMRQGWTFHPELTRDLFIELLKSSHQTPSLFHVNLLQEYLSLFPDLLWGSLEESRINVPGHISPHNWTFRFKYAIEEMAANDSLNRQLMEILS